MSSDGYLSIEPHTLRKYTILRKYLGVCEMFDKHYSNFVYVDTHGGSGRVNLGGKLIPGSPLIAGGWSPSFPCHIVEIDPATFSCLRESTSGHANVNAYHGDCNTKIDSILAAIPKGEKFVFCFVDPSSLVYRGPDGADCDQLCVDTVKKIAQFPRSELLLNFPLESILRCAGDCLGNPTEPRAIASGRRVTTFMGSTSWQKIRLSETHCEENRKAFLATYMDEVLGTYAYKGAFLVRTQQNNLPVYYLVYGTKNARAAAIMRDIMKKEYVETLGVIPLTKMQYKTDREWLDAEYPLTSPFIFED
jgi:three-Cys-motif partner protein